MTLETTRAKVPYPQDTDAPDGPTQLKAIAEKLEALANAAGSTNAKATLIPEEKTRTNTAYGLLEEVEGRTDQVKGIVLPAKGLIVIAYAAKVKSSVGSAGRSAIFIGANQLQTRNLGGVVGTEAAPTLATEAGQFRNVIAAPFGLVTLPNVTAAGDATTGQTLAYPIAEGGNPMVYDYGGSIFNIKEGFGGSGVCYVFAAAGTYDISVQHKASSGSISAKERKLYVWTREFV